MSEEVPITDTDRINWLASRPLSAEIQGGSKDGNPAVFWGISAFAGTTLRGAIDYMIKTGCEAKKPVESLPPETKSGCKCRACQTERLQSGKLPTLGMILCPVCGNKRCPKATNCRLACTNSNEPGQAGSIYA